MRKHSWIITFDKKSKGITTRAGQELLSTVPNGYVR